MVRRDPFLKTGITFAILSRSGCAPDVKERLMRSHKGLEIKFFIHWRIVVGMLYGPEALFLFNWQMIFWISSSSTGVKTNEFVNGEGRKSWKDLFPSYFLSFKLESAIVEK